MHRRLIRLTHTICCRVLIGLAVCLLVSAPSAAAEKRVALVIGNSAYRSLQRLDTAAGDAQLMADTLRATGFVLVGGRAQLDLDKAGVERALTDLSDQLSGADVALFYYAGHGVSLRGASYLLPVDADPATEADIDTQSINVARVFRQLDGARTKVNLVILEASRANPLSPALRAVEGGLAELVPPSRTLIASAARPGQLAREGDAGNSLFTQALARQMLRPGLDVMQAIHEVDLAVKRATGGRQEIAIAASPIDGGFHFVPDQPAQVFAPQVFPPPTTPPAARLPKAAAPPSLSGLTGPRAILYEEDPTAPQGLRTDGVVIWNTEPVDDAGKLAVRGVVDVPERGVRLSLLMRRNLDAALPASHTLELSFTVRRDVGGGGVDNAPGVLMKSAENTAGTPLAGLAVKVTGNTFLVGLSNIPADRARNIELLTTRTWFDIPIVYANKRRGILAVEMGPDGESAFREAFAAWGLPPPAVPGAESPPDAQAPPSGESQPPESQPSSDSYVVQVSSQHSEADAQAAYRALQDKYPAVLAQREPLIQRADLGQGRVYFRAVVGPFPTADAATQFCAELRTAGGQCIVQRNSMRWHARR